MFTSFNLLLQREEPTSHVLLAVIESFARKIANRIIKLYVLRGVKSIEELDLTDDDIYEDEESVFFGVKATSTLRALLDDGSITENQAKKFEKAAFNYFKESLLQIHKKFPFDDPVLHNAVWIDVTKRQV